MSLRIIHIVNSLSKINFGVWNAAIFASHWLAENAQIKSHVWICEDTNDSMPIPLPVTSLIGIQEDTIVALAHSQGLTTGNSLFVSHGCWLRPTRIGHQLKQKGFAWLYVPHGMLEPWSLQQGAVKKALYYFFFEGHFNRKASAVRAVSERERVNLENKLQRPVVCIENGVAVPDYSSKSIGERIYLFMARLHHKKGIYPLAQAWRSVMASDTTSKLIIAGPDEGELNRIKPLLGGNMIYIGAVYGERKNELLQQAHYFVLPSHSEGFPTSVLEGMSYGLIPLISEGCNFSTLFSNDLGYRAEPDTEMLKMLLLKLKLLDFDYSQSLRNRQFILSYYSEESIGRRLATFYDTLVRNNPVSA